MSKKVTEEPEYILLTKGYTIKSWYLKGNERSRGDALLEFSKDGNIIAEKIIPAYKLYDLDYISDILE